MAAKKAAKKKTIEKAETAGGADAPPIEMVKLKVDGVEVEVEVAFRG